MNVFRKFKFVLILIPLAVFIAFFDGLIMDNFLTSNEIPGHFRFIGVLILVVSVLLYLVFLFDKNINE